MNFLLISLLNVCPPAPLGKIQATEKFIYFLPLLLCIGHRGSWNLSQRHWAKAGYTLYTLYTLDKWSVHHNADIEKHTTIHIHIVPRTFLLCRPGQLIMVSNSTNSHFGLNYFTY